MSTWCNSLKDLFHRHNMERVAHWCDKECSVIIVEYKCTGCDHEAWDFVYFDDSRCKVLKRIPVEVSAINAPKLVKCGEPVCEQAKAPGKKRRSVGNKSVTKTSRKEKCKQAQAS